MRVSVNKQLNLWGKSTSAGAIGVGGYEPQRCDLWYLSMDGAVRGLNADYSLFYPEEEVLGTLAPQFAQSVTLPAFAVKADVFRRGNIPYNMPSWDEPLDAIKITFLMEQNGSLVSLVYTMCARWMNLVRLGRGSRYLGGTTDQDQWRLMERAGAKTPNFKYDFSIFMLRGGSSAGSSLISPTEMAQNNTTAQQQAEQQQRVDDAMKLNQPTTASAPVLSTSNTVSTVTGELEVSTIYSVKEAWIASFKQSDLTYAGCSLVTIEAAFFCKTVNAEREGGRVIQ